MSPPFRGFCVCGARDCRPTTPVWWVPHGCDDMSGRFPHGFGSSRPRPVPHHPPPTIYLVV